MTGMSGQAAAGRRKESATDPCGGRARSSRSVSVTKYTLSGQRRLDLQKLWQHQDHNKGPGRRLDVQRHRDEGEDELDSYILRVGGGTRNVSETRPSASKSRPGRPQ
eukprot:2208368-Pleurochrysis_carterae.AAC.1